jgi:hypothetical protein
VLLQLCAKTRSLISIIQVVELKLVLTDLEVEDAIFAGEGRLNSRAPSRGTYDPVATKANGLSGSGALGAAV